MTKPKTGKKQEKSPISKVLTSRSPKQVKFPLSKILNPLRQVKKQLIKAIDEKIITAVIAILFTLVILGLTTILGIRYFQYGQPQDIDAIKTIWAVLGTPYGLVLGYYFIK